MSDGYDHLEYERSLDEPLAPVMPSSWEGFARLEVDGYRNELTGKQYRMARKLAGRVRAKKPEVPAEVVAEKAVEMAKEKV